MRAREQLGLDLRPVRSMRQLVEHRLGIPIIQVELPTGIAGATISSNGQRGIVLNVTGANRNVWIRRTTLAHELAHIPFDPEAQLESVRVDKYEQLERDTEDTDRSLDEVEQRANAFAVEFIAPRGRRETTSSGRGSSDAGGYRECHVRVRDRPSRRSVPRWECLVAEGRASA